MKMSWFLLGAISMISFTIMFLLFKKIGDLGVSSNVLMLYYFGMAATILLIYMFSTKIPLEVTRYALLFLIVAAIAGIFGNIFLVESMRTAPNPGYSLAVSSVYVLLVAVASIFIFKSEFTLIKGIGTFLVVAGIVLIGL